MGHAGEVSVGHVGEVSVGHVGEVSLRHAVARIRSRFITSLQQAE